MGFSCPHCAQDVDGAIPKERLDQVIEERNAARTDLAARDADLVTAKETAAGAEALTAERDTALADLAAARTGHESYKAITAAGIAAEVVDGFVDAYDRMGADRPTTIGEWIGGLADGTIAAPALLAPHVPGSNGPGEVAPSAPVSPPPTATDHGAAPPAPPTSPPPSANTGARPHPHAPDPVNTEAILRMSPAEYREHKSRGAGGVST